MTQQNYPRGIEKRLGTLEIGRKYLFISKDTGRTPTHSYIYEGEGYWQRTRLTSRFSNLGMNTRFWEIQPVEDTGWDKTQGVFNQGPLCWAEEDGIMAKIEAQNQPTYVQLGELVQGKTYRVQNLSSGEDFTAKFLIRNSLDCCIFAGAHYIQPYETVRIEEKDIEKCEERQFSRCARVEKLIQNDELRIGQPFAYENRKYSVHSFGSYESINAASPNGNVVLFTREKRIYIQESPINSPPKGYEKLEYFHDIKTENHYDLWNSKTNEKIWYTGYQIKKLRLSENKGLWYILSSQVSI